MERYYFYIDYANNQKGPLTLDRLIDEQITSSTLIWHDELPSWVEAGSQDEVAEKLRKVEESRADATPPPTPAVDAPLFEPYKNNPPRREPETPKRPKSWLVESVLATLLCCMPLGIVSLIFSLLSTEAWNNHDYDKALRYSNRSGLWFKITLIASVILIPLIIMISINLAIFPLFLFSDF